MVIEPPIFHVGEASVRIGAQTIIDGLSFDLKAGEFLCILGPNGAGKSTCLKVLVGLTAVAEGEVLLSGVPVATTSRRELATKVSYVPQGDPGGFAFTVRSFVEMGRYPYLGPWQPLSLADREAVEQAMRTTEVHHLADRLIGSLSGGERQRTVIAAALAQGGRVLLLDEPTSFLDYRHQLQVLELLEHLHQEQGYTIIAVTHDLNSTLGLADRALALVAGRSVFFGPPGELLDDRRLEQIFDCPFSMVDAPGLDIPVLVPKRSRVGRGRP